MWKQENNRSETRRRSLQDTLETVLAWPELEDRRRTQLASSIRTFARVVGRPPAAIEENIIVIREEMAKANAARASIESSTWATVRSSVMASLRLCGLPVISGRHKVPCSPATRALLDKIPAKPHQLSLGPVARWCSENGVELAEFNQEQSELLRTDVFQRHPKKYPQRVYRRAVKMWNQCREEFPEFWPQTKIEPIFKFARYGLGESAFSAALNADADAMINDAVKPPLRRREAHRAIKQSTADKRRYTVYRVASAVALERGIDPSTFEALADLVDPDAVEDALDFVVRRNGEKKSGDLHGIAKTMYTIAKYWVRADDSQLEALANIRGAVKPDDDGPSQKNIDLCLMFKNPRLQEDFLLMPERVIGRLRRKKKLSRSDAVQAQLAAIAGLMIDAPMRSANIVQLRLGLHILDTGWGTTRQVRIHVPGQDVKNEVSQNFLLRAGTVRLLDIYTKSFLQRLTRDSSGFLIPGRNGHKRPSNLSVQLAALTTRELGVRMTAHQWRHVVGSIFLRYHPGEYEPVRRLLGHKCIETTMQFYAFMLKEDAQETVDSTFEDLRQRGRHSYRRRAGRKAA